MSNSPDEQEVRRRIGGWIASSPWVLRLTEHKGKPAPVLVVKERYTPAGGPGENGAEPERTLLRDRGIIYGQALRRCLPVIRSLLSRVHDPMGVPAELQRLFANGPITFRGNLPLNHESGAKLALLCKLQERLKDMDRVELIARRVERFSREEAEYWLSRATQYGPAVNRWSQAGMRLMLGGQPGDPAIGTMLDRLRG